MLSTGGKAYSFEKKVLGLQIPEQLFSITLVFPPYRLKIVVFISFLSLPWFSDWRVAGTVCYFGLARVLEPGNDIMLGRMMESEESLTWVMS